MNNIVQSRNPLGVHEPGFGILRYTRPIMARPAPAVPAPDLGRAPDQAPQTDTTPRREDKQKDKGDRKREPKLGRIYVTYQRYNHDTGLYYSGRTSMVI